MWIRLLPVCRHSANLGCSIFRQNVNQHSQMKLVCIKLRNFHCLIKESSDIHTRCKQTLNKFSTQNTLKHRSIRTGKEPTHVEAGIKNEFSRLVRPFGFVVLASTASFTGAAIWQYESLRYRAKRHMKDIETRTLKAGSVRQHINSLWSQFTAGQRVVLGIIGLNVAVFAMWKIPSLQPVMLKYFVSNPAIGAPCWSMLLSSFSHYSFLHLAVNMYVLWSFSSVAVSLFGKEQFVAMYLTGDGSLVAVLAFLFLSFTSYHETKLLRTISSFASYLIKILRGSLQASLGASGAILTVLGAVCQSYPDSRLSIALIGELVPHSFSAQTGLYCILLFDSLGVLFDWHFFDHAAHLGGALFGLWYAKYGHRVVWKRREPVVKMWHKMRSLTGDS